MKRFAWIYLILTLLAAAAIGLIYEHNPSGTMQVLHDVEKDFPTSLAAAQDKAVWQKLALEVRADLAGLFSGREPAPESSGEPSSTPEGQTPAPVAPPVPMPPVPPAPPPPLSQRANWTWTTKDGHVYNDVVVTKMDDETVAITHARGVAHLNFSDLPHDLLVDLGKEVGSARAANAETARENEHPYYRVAQTADAEEVAKQMHRPLAWLCSDIGVMSDPHPLPQSEGDLTQLAIQTLKPTAVVVFLDGDAELSHAPPPVVHEFAQFASEHAEVGSPTDPPRIVFTDPDGTSIFGRVASTQLRAVREAALNEETAAIKKYAMPDSPPVGPSPSTSPAPAAPVALSPPTSPTTSAAPALTPATTTAASPPVMAPTNAPASETNTAPEPPVAPAIAPAASSPAPTPAASASGAPTPPIPAHMNWTWNTLDGHEYDQVVVVKTEPTSVTITHLRGIAHVDIATLPKDLLHELGYADNAVEAARQEAQRQQEHPFYHANEIPQAEAAAQATRLPLAWVCGNLSSLSAIQPAPGYSDELTQMAVEHLKTKSIIIFLDSNPDLGKAPPAVLNQFFQRDDGPLPDGHHFIGPKIVFSDATAQHAFGRVPSTIMKVGREASIDSELAKFSTVSATPANESTAPSTGAPTESSPATNAAPSAP